jgi:nucleotide-binding universal stress UspA family protein
MKSVLVAIDGSEPSLKGVRMAVELARQAQAKLQLVTVVAPVLQPPSVYAETIQKIEDGNRATAHETLSRAARVVMELGSDCQQVVLQGAPAEAIADLASDPEVWGVVIGAKGHNALSRVMLGSVTDRLVHICSKPVLVVR